PIHIGHREPVVEKAEMKFALLQHPADMPVVLGRPGVHARERMSPGTRKVGAILRLQEGDQSHLAHGSGSFDIADAPGDDFRWPWRHPPFDARATGGGTAA